MRLREFEAAGEFGMRIEENRVKPSTAVMLFFTLAKSGTNEQLPLITIPAK